MLCPQSTLDQDSVGPPGPGRRSVATFWPSSILRQSRCHSKKGSPCGKPQGDTSLFQSAGPCPPSRLQRGRRRFLDFLKAQLRKAPRLCVGQSVFQAADSWFRIVPQNAGDTVTGPCSSFELRSLHEWTLQHPHIRLDMKASQSLRDVREPGVAETETASTSPFLPGATTAPSASLIGGPQTTRLGPAGSIRPP